MYGLYRIPVYRGFGLDRFHCNKNQANSAVKLRLWCDKSEPICCIL